MKYSIIIFFVGFCAFWGVSQCSCDSLVAAIEVGDSATVRSCLDSGTDPNCKTSEFREDSTNTFDENQNVITVAVTYHWRITPLTTALHEDNFGIVQLLLDAGASTNTPEVCLEEVNYGETINLRLTPLKIAKNMAQADEVTALLLANGALTERELERRGDRMAKLSMCYDNGSFPCRDSILKLHELIDLWQGMVYLDEEFMISHALRSNDILLLRYLVDVHHVSLKERPERYVTVGMGMFRRTLKEERFAPFGSLVAGNKLTVSSILYLETQRSITDEQIYNTFLQYRSKYKDRRKVAKYFKMERKYKDVDMKSSKKERVKKKMQKLYHQLEAKNGIKARLENDFSEGCR